VTIQELKDSGVGKMINKLMDHLNPEISEPSKRLKQKWVELSVSICVGSCGWHQFFNRSSFIEKFARFAIPNSFAGLTTFNGSKHCLLEEN
jgi:hypothetical protein